MHHLPTCTVTSLTLVLVGDVKRSVLELGPTRVVDFRGPGQERARCAMRLVIKAGLLHFTLAGLHKRNSWRCRNTLAVGRTFRSPHRTLSVGMPGRLSKESSIRALVHWDDERPSWKSSREIGRLGDSWAMMGAQWNRTGSVCLR